MHDVSHHIGGFSPNPAGTLTADVYNPSTGAIRAATPIASAHDVDDAVQAAHTAFHTWSHSSIAARMTAMRRLAELVRANADELAELVSSEHGKLVQDAHGEIARGVDNIEFACGTGEQLKGHVLENASTDVDVRAVRRPIGVVAAITPFNFPIMVPLWMIPNAIACGNTVVLKPSERCPSAPTRLVQLVEEAGFPAGVVNVLHGDRSTVEDLITHPRVRAVSFVGSTNAAESVHQLATSHNKRVQALGGAKNHMVVLPDADLARAADAAVSAAFGSAGERCMAVSVVVAVGGIADALVDAIRTRSEDLRLGYGDDLTADIGPLITEEHRDRVAKYISAGEEAGAEIIVDGRRVQPPSASFFLGASVLDRVSPDMTVYEDEIFGPVLSIVRVDSLDDALGLISDNPWGNGAALFTNDAAAARRFQADTDAGMVGINVAIPVPVGHFSFGGWKNSAFGDHAIYGPDGVHFYTRQKVITTRYPHPQTSGGLDLNFPTSR